MPALDDAIADAPELAASVQPCRDAFTALRTTLSLSNQQGPFDVQMVECIRATLREHDAAFAWLDARAGPSP